MKNSYVISALIALVTCFTSKMYAQENNDPNGAKHTYISEIAIETKQWATDRLHFLPDNGYTVIDYDLNKGLVGSDYVYLGYKTTTDPKEAITDIIMLVGSEWSGVHHKVFNFEDKQYQAANFSSYPDGHKYHGNDSRGGNLNRGESGSSDLFLYYTKSRKSAGMSSGDVSLEKLDVKKRIEHDIKCVSLVTFGVSLMNPEKGPHWMRGGAADMNFGLRNNQNMPIYIEMDKHEHKKISDTPDPDGFCYCECGCVLDDMDEIPGKSRDGYYEIKNDGQLLWFSNYVNEDVSHNNACARLCANLDMEKAHQKGLEYLPIGYGNKYATNGDIHNYWAGNFDGNGYTISNLQINRKGPIGLVGLGKNCTIKDLRLENVDIKINERESEFFCCSAGFIGYGAGNITVKNCEVSGKIHCDVGEDEGSAAGFLNLFSKNDTATIIECTNLAEVCGKWHAAGFVLTNDSNSYVGVDKCINHGKVKLIFTGSAFSCAMTDSENGYIKNCLNTGDVETFAYSSMPVSHAVSNQNDFFDHCDHFYLFPVSSGEACFNLNNQSTTDSVWTQQLGKDDYPIPRKGNYIVDRYFKYDEDNNPVAHYTNYAMYADDMNNVHHYKPQNLQIARRDSSRANVTLVCDLCNKQHEYVEAHLVEKKTIRPRTCDTSALVEYIYQVDDVDGENVQFPFIKEIENSSPETHIYQYEETLGVNQCYLCGHVQDGNYEGPEIVDGVAKISKLGHFMYYVKSNGRIDAVLMNDLDLRMLHADLSSLVIGNFNSPFTCNFDGGGHTISGYYVSSNNENQSLFGNIVNATIKNLNLEGGVIGQEDNENVALLCNNAYNSVIENCIVRGTVSGQQNAAGICNEMVKSTIFSCRNYADVTSTDDKAAGIVGVIESDSSMVHRCANYGKVDAKKAAGGIVAENQTYARIWDCANYNEVAADTHVGGIIGAINTDDSNARILPVRYCINTGKVVIKNESNSKGAVCGDVHLKDDDCHLEPKQFYYMNSIRPVGTMENGKLVTNNVECVSPERFASDEICYCLNYMDYELYDYFNSIFEDETNDKGDEPKDDSEETEFINATKAIWALDDVMGKRLPSPYGAKKREIIHVNGGKIYVVEGEELDQLNIEDGYYFNSPTTFTVKEIAYNRSNIKVRKDFYATVCLPFAFNDERLKVFTITAYDKQTGRLCISEVQNPQADTPYVVRVADDCPDEEVELIIKSANQPVHKTEPQFPKLDVQIPTMPTGFYGTYANKRVNGTHGFYCYSTKYGDFRKANTTSGTLVGPFRAAYKLGMNETSDITTLSLYEGSVTGLDASYFIEADVNAPVYNLQGQRVGTSGERLPRGIYIKGGKKIFVK